MASGSILLSSAQAALPGAPLCGTQTTNRVCIYDGNNWVGLIGNRAAGGGLVNLSSSYNDKMDSWWNESDTNGRWYDNPDGGGGCHNLPKSAKDNDVNWSHSDELDSWATNGLCP